MSTREPASRADEAITVASGRTEDAIAFLRQLVSCRTESQNPDNPDFRPEALRCLDLASGKLAALGFELHQWDTAEGYPTLAARLPGAGGGRSLTFNGHLDVVPVGDTSGWSHDPWRGEIDGRRLYGRGTADMKAGVAAALYAVKRTLRAGPRPAGDVWFHLVTDEEVVGYGTRECIARLPATDAVLDVEPTDLAVIPVEGGLEHLRIEIEGREAHAATRAAAIAAGGGGGPGVNAVEKGVKLLTAIQELERRWANQKSHPLLPPGYNSLLPAIFVAGPGGGKEGRLNMLTNPGTMANYCSIEYNIWYYPFETLAEIKRDFEAYVLAVCQTDEWLRAHPPVLTWGLRHISFPPFETSPDHPFIQTLIGSAAQASGRPEVKGFPAASDLAWYAARGIPGAIYGPGALDQAHSPDEYVSLDDFQRSIEVYARLIAAWCGVERAAGERSLAEVPGELSS
jgi:acetylornithine deacetylase